MKTAKLRWTTLMVALVVMCLCYTVWAEEQKTEGGEPTQEVKTVERPSIAAEIGFLSKYVWRGYELSNNSLVIQPSITVGYKGFSANLWGNLDTYYDDMDPTTSRQAEWTETDFTVAYDHTFGPVNLGGGVIYYALDAADDSVELYISIGGNFLLSPTLTVYREVYNYPGWYINFGISHSFPLPWWDMSLDLAGSVGYYYSDDDDFVEVREVGGMWVPTSTKYRNFHDGSISAALNIPIAKYFTITPKVVYTFPLSHEADKLLTSSSYTDRSNYVYGGISASVAF